jgi:hypothetical protein
VLTGLDGDEKSANPPFNEPKPLPPHSHEDGFHPWCEICIEQRRVNREEIDRERG